jgi:hypothetical protein
MIKSGLYSSKQLFICTCIGGPAISGFIIACNLWAIKKRWIAIISTLPGLILGFALLFLTDFLLHAVTADNPHILSSIVVRHVVAFAFYFLMLAGFAVIVRLILRWNIRLQTSIFPVINISKFHSRKIYPALIISFIYLVTSLAFNIYLFAVLVFYLFVHFYAYILIYNEFGDIKIARAFLVCLVILACILPLIDTTGQILYVYGHLKLLSITYLNLFIGYYTIFIF